MKPSKLSIEYFLAHQDRLFDDPVVFDEEEAGDFLEENFAELFESIGEVREFLEKEGMDVSALTDAELAEEAEVFPIPDGTFLVVEA